MALIGDMQYLTIGNKTYRIASSLLPIASASTLGGIKVGTGLTIDSTTGVLNATGTSITIDNTLSDTSTNPVQNKVIKEALDNKANTTNIPTKTSDLTNDSNFMSGMTILSYGSSTWNDFLTAYQANHVVYCRASSNSNPASGSQTRMAFMAYVSDATNPTNVEFQYYRSVSSHSASQQGDQVYVYKLTNANAWTVTVREASVKVTTGSSDGIDVSYSSGAVTIGHTNSVTAQSTQALYPITYDAQGHITSSGTSVSIPTKVSDLTNDSGFITSYTETDPTVPSWAKASTKPSYTASLVGAAASDHVHGNITNSGDITATAPTIASGDKLIINDLSVSKITNGPSFGTSTTTYLRNDGTWGTPEGTLPQVVSPIAIDTETNDAIYHLDSGVTAGTYAAAGSKNGSFYIPSFVVDIYGHITSATNLGTVVPTIGNASANTYGGLITDYSFGSTLRTANIYGGGRIYNGDTSGTCTINTDTYGPYTYSSHWRVADVQAWNVNTGKTVIVDWSVSTSGTAKIVTASIAESYADDIYFVPIITTYAPM